MFDASKDRIVLIPGLFGFGSFGKGATAIEFFLDVKRELASSTGIPEDRMHVHEPPPTGSLRSRVRSLCERVLAVMGEDAASGRGGGRIHLIGHSTGGLDARLLMHREYVQWKQPPALDAARERVGRVVTLAAPLFGTPIADNIAMPFRLLLDGLSISVIFDRQLGGAILPPGGFPLLHLLSRAPGASDLPYLRRVVHVRPDTWNEIEHFRALVVSDGRLVDDLKPASMAKLAAEMGADGEYRNMIHYVTMAPQPSLGTDALDRRVVYAACHRAAESASFKPKGTSELFDIDRWPPRERWVGAGAYSASLGEPPKANDGIVPCCSQALPGFDTRFVLADHLDVVGHFSAEGQNVTILQSDARFGKLDFQALWADIGRAIRED
jgi:triacylglycerol lipase